MPYLPVAPMTSTLVLAAWGVSKSSELPEMPPRVSRVSLGTDVLPGALRFENRFHTASSTALQGNIKLGCFHLGCSQAGREFLSVNMSAFSTAPLHINAGIKSFWASSTELICEFSKMYFLCSLSAFYACSEYTLQLLRVLQFSFL